MDIIDKILDWEEKSKNEIGLIPLYHYTNVENVGKVLSPREVIIRATRVEDFPDIHEGKNIQPIFMDVLQRLSSLNVISDKQIEMLEKIPMPDKRLAAFNKTDPTGMVMHFIKSTKMIPYVMCFSQEKNSGYMFQHYLKGTDQGYCLYFDGNNILDRIKKNQLFSGYKFRSYVVFYRSQAVDWLFSRIKALYQCFDEPDYNENVEVFVPGLISNLLHDLQYSVKEDKYSPEREARIVLFIPSENLDIQMPYCERDSCGKRYIDVAFHKAVFRNLYPAPKMDAEEDRLIKTRLFNNGYHLSI